MKIVFMGTPDFARVSLEKIINEEYNIIGVFTQPDRKQGRGKKILPSPVKILAENHNIPVFQPISMKKQESIDLLKKLNPDICIVVAYGQILPKAVLDIPKFGSINIHGSLLPLYRGAAPIQWSIINGEKTTGVTSMYISEGLDEGDIILKKEIKLDDMITSGELFTFMAEVGAEVLDDTLKLIENKNATRTPQSEMGIKPTFAPMLDKKMALLNFSNESDKIHNLVRGLNPWPIATTNFRNQTLKIYNSEVASFSGRSVSTGEIVDNKEFIVSCGNNTFINLLEVQLAGKKRVAGRDFINGNRIKIGEKIG